MATLDRLRVYPVKALDGIDVESSAFTAGGTLAHDREFALSDDEGAVINGKRTAAVHTLETSFDPDSYTLTVETPDGTRRRFDLDAESDRRDAASWFGEYFDCDVTIERDRSLGYVDRRSMGPSVISTATIETVADWFADLSVESVRRRLRANVEIGGVDPFWEDRFVGADAPAFEIDGVRFEGVTPCGRCIVPARDPDSGEETPEFRERFARKRRETFPDWADESAFDHFYSLMTITRVPEADRSGTLRVGDEVTFVE
ncbi:putative Fe-S protein [Halovivax ruber XH-70]|uniref:Putative Fe-S protein n=1 Tax=Halovivax ruber (strain DSM 18193 / JCM 13892 / XH-70) TaxID=797302 RepID=L0I9M6_HALRX|nr:MOSC N-terminal beta barrel domain-containing protein [Halovivax ruber]AGB15414.1 putative Fe-S protein [Halovivax ruber XH-70]